MVPLSTEKEIDVCEETFASDELQQPRSPDQP
jgi:hypothetical protein